jgi:hypothetical protein
MSTSQFEDRLRTILEAYSLPGRRIAFGAQTPLVLLKDDQGMALLIANNVIPTDGVVGYAKGCIFLKTDAGAGVSGFYENRGTTASCAFRQAYSPVIAVSAGYPISLDNNASGLTSAITLANALRVTMNAHAAHRLGPPAVHATADATNFPITAVASDLTTLLVLAGLLLSKYDAHDADAELGVGWAFHIAQEAGDHSLVSAVTPTDLSEAITRLNDLKAKFNAHDADATCHTTGSQHQEATGDAALAGVVARIYEADALLTDGVVWGILDGGAGPKVGVTAAAGAGFVDFTFDADPVADVVISYSIVRL